MWGVRISCRFCWIKVLSENKPQTKLKTIWLFSACVEFMRYLLNDNSLTFMIQLKWKVEVFCVSPLNRWKCDRVLWFVCKMSPRKVCWSEFFQGLVSLVSFNNDFDDDVVYCDKCKTYTKRAVLIINFIIVGKSTQL